MTRSACARSQGGVDLDAIAAWRKRFPLGMRQAEPPAPRVIGGDVWNGVGLVRQRIEMLLQLGELDDLVHRLRVADNVQVVPLKIDDAPSCRVGNESVANVPLVRDDPVERLRSRGDFMAPKPGQNAPEIIERAPHAIAGEAAANGKHVRCPSMHFVAAAIAGASRLRFGHGTSPNDWKSTETKALFTLRNRQFLGPRNFQGHARTISQPRNASLNCDAKCNTPAP